MVTLMPVNIVEEDTVLLKHLTVQHEIICALYASCAEVVRCQWHYAFVTLNNTFHLKS